VKVLENYIRSANIQTPKQWDVPYRAKTVRRVVSLLSVAKRVHHINDDDADGYSGGGYLLLKNS
jgi:hypothetical protein